jgi:predicted nuclease with TOPRIM domain
MTAERDSVALSMREPEGRSKEANEALEAKREALEAKVVEALLESFDMLAEANSRMDSAQAENQMTVADLQHRINELEGRAKASEQVLCAKETEAQVASKKFEEQHSGSWSRMSRRLLASRRWTSCSFH